MIFWLGEWPYGALSGRPTADKLSRAASRTCYAHKLEAKPVRAPVTDQTQQIPYPEALKRDVKTCLMRIFARRASQLQS